MMKTTDGDTIVAILIKHIAVAKEPVTCYDLYDILEVATLCKTVAVVSNYLGYMWRNGMLHRVAAGRTEKIKVRYAYSLNTNSHRAMRLVDAPAETTAAQTTKHLNGKLEVNETNKSFTLRLPDMSITISLH